MIKMPAMSPMAKVASARLGLDVSKLNLSDEDIAKLLIAVTTATSPTAGKSKATVKLIQPRVGTVDDTGVFTGLGARGEGKLPSSPDCHRAFDADKMKNHTAMKSIQEACRSGQADDTLIFCAQHKSNANRVVLSIRAMEKEMIQCGMEGAFIVKMRDGASINMFQEPGLINSLDVIDTWCEDLTKNGVWNDNGTQRLNVCPHDLTNMTWSHTALLKSCSETLEDSISAKISHSKECGPKALGEILFHAHRPSHSKIEALRMKLKALKLTDFPAEGTFQQKMCPCSLELPTP